MLRAEGAKRATDTSVHARHLFFFNNNETTGSRPAVSVLAFAFSALCVFV
jgi:hypothetical protein